LASPHHPVTNSQDHVQVEQLDSLAHLAHLPIAFQANL
jgi:hypothetical protein